MTSPDHEVRVELLVYRRHFFAREVVPGGELCHRFEVVVLPPRQAPVEHAGRRLTYILESVYHAARDEDDRPGSRGGGLVTDGQLIGALDDEEHLFLTEMDVVGRTFAGLVPPHEDRDGTAGGLRGEEHFEVEAEGFEGRCIFWFDDTGLQWCGS